jgi:hypothetical protein
LRLHCSFNAEVTSWTLEASQVGKSSFVAVVTSGAVVAVVLVKLFCLRVPGANFTFVHSLRVQHTVADRRTVVTHGTFSCGVISFWTKVAWLTSCALVHLFCSSDNTLSFKRTIHRPVVSFRTVVACRAFFARWVWLDCVVGFRTEVASCAVISYQVSTTIVGRRADRAVCVRCVEVGAGGTQWLSLLST